MRERDRTGPKLHIEEVGLGPDGKDKGQGARRSFQGRIKNY